MKIQKCLHIHIYIYKCIYKHINKRENIYACVFINTHIKTQLYAFSFVAFFNLKLEAQRLDHWIWLMDEGKTIPSNGNLLIIYPSITIVES